MKQKREHEDPRILKLKLQTNSKGVSLVSQDNCSSLLLGIEGALIQSISESNDRLTIQFRLQRRPHRCPRCQQTTETVHDYRIRRVKDLPSRMKPVIWLYEKRRYRCLACGKRFAEKLADLPRYHRHSNRLVAALLTELGCLESLVSLARRFGVSPSTLHRWQQLLSYGPPDQLPAVLGIDEFRGNAGGERFQCILTDPERHRVLDILPNRNSTELTTYFLQFSRAQRQRVRWIVMDMSSLFYQTLRPLFPEAAFIADRFHVVRYAVWSLELVRKRVQQAFAERRRRYFKRSRRLLLCHRAYLSETDQAAVDQMLALSEPLALAYHLKELFYRFMAAPSRAAAVPLLLHFRLSAHAANLPEFQPCLTMLANWETLILNSFDRRVTNGFTEGTNNKIKVLKRLAFGYRNFGNFRRRILAATAKDAQRMLAQR